MQQGWKTGAIIPELEEEIESSNSEHFKRELSNLLALESTLNKQVGCCTAVASRCDLCPLSVQNLATVGDEVVDQWKAERDTARYEPPNPPW